MSQSGGINELKNLLFEEESKKFALLEEKLGEFQDKVAHDFKHLKVPEGEVEQLVDHITEIMPERLGPAITKTLQKQIRESRDEVVQVLYPIMGQMIKKYIQKEIELLSEKIDQQFEQLFSWDRLMAYFKGLFTGTKPGGDMIRKAVEPQVEEIFLIENDSGILLASYSRNKTMDQDLIAGMLTAIKSFVGEAFEKENQSLETIEYDLYKIYIQNFQKFYVAVVLSGVLTSEFKSRLDDTIMKFVKDLTIKAADSANEEVYKLKLEEYFANLNKITQ